MISKTTILITGARSKVINGFISLLLENKFNVLAITRKKSENHRSDVKWIEQDLSDKHIDWSCIKEVDIILHAAAVSNTYDETEYISVNIMGTKRLVEAAKYYGVKQFIYISSIFADNSCGIYSKSKAEAEKIITSNLDHYIIIRPSQLFGYHKNPIDKLIEDLKNNRMNFYPSASMKNLYPLYFVEFIKLLKEIVIDGRETPKICTLTGPDLFNFKELMSEIVRIKKYKGIQIPIPKFLMKMAAFFIRTLKLKIGVYNDQIYRLYHAEPKTENRIISPISLKSVLLTDSTKNDFHNFIS